MTTLVLLPGMDGTGALFGPLLEVLAGRLRVTVISYPADRALGYDALEPIADAALPPEGPLVLLGESFSGPLAIALAARHGDRVRGLILCNTFATNPRPLLGMLRGLIRALPIASGPIAPMAWLLHGRFDTPLLRSALVQAVRHVRPAVMRVRLRAVVDVDARPRLQRVTCPLLYLQATEDLLVPASAGRRLVRGRPEAELLRLPGPHALLQAAPDACAKVILAFVRDTAAAAANGNPVAHAG